MTGPITSPSSSLVDCDKEHLHTNLQLRIGPLKSKDITQPLKFLSHQVPLVPFGCKGEPHLANPLAIPSAPFSGHMLDQQWSIAGLPSPTHLDLAASQGSRAPSQWTVVVHIASIAMDMETVSAHVQV